MLKEAFYFWHRIFLFRPKWLEGELYIVMSWELVRLKAYDLKLILSTHLMAIRRVENFLWAFEVAWMENLGSQKVVKTIDFQYLIRSGEKTRPFCFNSSIRTWSNDPGWRLVMMNPDSYRVHNTFWTRFRHRIALSRRYLIAMGNFDRFWVEIIVQ